MPKRYNGLKAYDPMKASKNYTVIHKGIPFILVLLFVQFVVGMYLNFYAQLPPEHPGVHGSYAPSIPWVLAGHAGIALAVHVAIWILLTLGSIALLIRSVLARNKRLIVGTAAGLFFIFVAGSGGLTFLNRGGADKDSFMMALGFMLALTSYAITYYKMEE